MERAPHIRQAVLDDAADILDSESRRIIERWLRRIQEAIHSLQPGLSEEEMRESAPLILRGVAEALRHGQPGSLDAPWTEPARRHAMNRRNQGEELGDLLREFVFLREEVWAVLSERLAGMPGDDVFDLARDLGSALDAMATNASRTYGAQLQLYRLFSEHARDIILFVDENARIVEANRAAEQTYGYSRDELLSLSIYDLRAAEKTLTVRDEMAQAQAQGIIFETLHRRRDGSVFPVEVSSRGATLGGRRILLSIVRDITERKQAEQERERLLAESERRAAEVDAVIASIRDGIVIYGPEGQIVRMNRAAEKLLGMTQSEYAAMSPQEREQVLRIEGPDGKPLAPDQTAQARALRGEDVVGFRERIRRRDGSTRELLASAGPIRNDEGRIIGVVRSLSDISDIVKLQQEREDILRAVSHDLRNPLAAVLGQAQICERRLAKAGLERERESASSIIASAQRMNTMIQDLVDAARSETGQLRLDWQPIDLRAFAHDLLNRLAPVLDTGRITVEVPEGLPPVSADPARLERIFTNLLSNALKYSAPDAPVTISARQEGGVVVTSVTDRGRGIPPEDLPHLFQRYFRVQQTQQAGSGLGLGLYVTRMLVEAHGGRIWVESAVGQGSTFSFSLPVASSAT